MNRRLCNPVDGAAGIINRWRCRVTIAARVAISWSLGTERAEPARPFVGGSRPPAAPFARHRRTSSHIVARRPPVVSPRAVPYTAGSTGAPTTVRGRFFGVYLPSVRTTRARVPVMPAIRDKRASADQRSSAIRVVSRDETIRRWSVVRWRQHRRERYRRKSRRQEEPIERTRHFRAHHTPTEKSPSPTTENDSADDRRRPCKLVRDESSSIVREFCANRIMLVGREFRSWLYIIARDHRLAHEPNVDERVRSTRSNVTRGSKHSAGRANIREFLAVSRRIIWNATERARDTVSSSSERHLSISQSDKFAWKFSSSRPLFLPPSPPPLPPHP